MTSDQLTNAPGQAAARAAVSTLRLVHLSGSLAGRTQDLRPGTVTRVGRHPESEVRFDHATDFLVSTRHGQLAVEGGQWVFADTGSTNGTWVDGRRVQRQVLGQGQTLVLGTPGAAGSAVFRVDLGGTAEAVAPIDDVADAFAPEPPPSTDDVPVPVVPPILYGGPAAGPPPAAAGGPPPMIPAPVAAAPAAAAPADRGAGGPSAPPRPPAGPPPAGPAPGAGHPPVVIPEDSGLFGGIKGAVNRMRERRTLIEEVAELEKRLPKLEADAVQRCAALGRELWTAAGTDTARLACCAVAARLAAIDAPAQAIAARRRAADDKAVEQTTAHQKWVEEYQVRRQAEEAELAAAARGLNDARAEQARAREAVAAAVAGRGEQLAALADRMAKLAAEARQGPRDDFHARYQELGAELERRLRELSGPIDGLDEKVAARTAAVAAVLAATTRNEAAAARLEASERENADRAAARTDGQRQHQQQVAALSAEMERARQPASALYGDLGRQYVDAADAPAFNPPPPSLTAARAAVEQLKQAQAALSFKRQRAAELD